MLILPIQLNEREYTILIALQDDNLERIRQYDPAEVNLAKIAQSNRAFDRLRLRDVVITYATAEDEQEVMRLCQAGDWRAAGRFLSRGFRYRPDAGDHDGPYLSARKREGEQKQ